MDRSILVVLLGLLSCGHAIQCPKQKTSPGREVVCYTSVSGIDELTESVCRCTTLVHQGHDIRNLSTSDIEGLQKSLREINPPLQFVVSVDDPTKVLGTSGSVRQEATARLIRLLKEVDGVELNVTVGSKERLFNFVKGLKDEMVKKSYDKRLFLVLPSKSDELAKQFDLKELSKYIDLFTVPTHFLVEEDEAYHTYHPSRLMGIFDMINTDSLIDLISGLGAPKRKILVSLPASVYKFTLKNEDENTPRSPAIEKEPVVINRKELCELMNKGEWTIERDEDLTAPYAFKNKTWVSFEDNISVGIKGKYALLRDLPGLSVHNIEDDFKTKCGKPIAHEIHHSFTDFKRKSRAAVLSALEDDLHQSEINYPNHVKSSDFRVVRVVDTEGHIRVVRENTQTEFSCTRQGYFVHPKSCNRFYRCVKFNQEVEDYSVFEFDCPAGLAFDENTEVCVWPGSLPEGSPCPGSSEIAPVGRVRFHCPTEPGYYADPQNGRWFFACIDLGGPELMAYEFRCPYGLVFDEDKLVCEWPWLVRGYEGGYTKNLYDTKAYGGGSTSQGTGGYVTGGLPHGFSATTGIGGYSGSTAGGRGGQASVAYSGSSAGVGGQGSGGKGFSGPAGVEYAGSVSGGHGSSYGGGYSGSTSGGHGSTFGQGYAGSATGGQGSSYGQTYTGSVAGTQEGTYGRGQSGSAIGSDGTVFGQGYSGSTTGSQGSGFGQGYSGSTTGSQGSGFGQGYSGSTTGSQGSGFGQTYGGSTRVEGHQGISSGQTYIGATSGTQGASSGETYLGSTSGSQGISFGQGHTGSASGSQSTFEQGYAGSAGGSQSTFGQGHAGSVTGSQTTFGQGHAGSVGGSQSTFEQGHLGSVGGSQSAFEHGYSGSTATNVEGTYGTSDGSRPSSPGRGYSASSSTSNSGETGGIFSGPRASPHIIPGQGYSAVSGGSTIPQGYSGTSGVQYSGSASHGSGGSTETDIASGVSTGTGSYTSSGRTHVGVDYSQSTDGSYYGSTSGVYSGSTSDSDAGFRGTPSGVYPGSSAGSHPVSTDAGYSTSYSTSNSGETGGIFSGPRASPHIIPSRGPSGGVDRTGSIDGGYRGSSDGSYTGSSDGSYTGSSDGGYSGSTAGVHVGSIGYSNTIDTGSNLVPGKVGIGYTTGSDQASGSIGHTGVSGSTYGGLGSTAQSGYSQTKYTGGKVSGGSLKVGYEEPGYTIPVAIGQPGQAPTYTYTGTAGSSDTFGSHGQTVGVTLGTHGQGAPSVSYIPSTSGAVGTGGAFGQKLPGIATTYVDHSGSISGYANEIGVSSGSVTSGATTYEGYGGYQTGFRAPGGKGNSSVTHFGSGVSTPGSIYQGDFSSIGGSAGTGAILTGNTIQGSIATDDSTSGVLISHGDTSGSVYTGSSDQGQIITGSSKPGFVDRGAGTPGYVLSGGVKTVYTGSAQPATVIHGVASPGVVLTGTPAPGTVLRGQSTPGVIVAGQTAPGVLHGGAIEQGTVVGSLGNRYFTDSAGYQSKGTSESGSAAVTSDAGYKTNEYHDNGGRGTIKFNNGYVTTKYAESDIPDYRPAGGSLPDSLTSGVKLGVTPPGLQTAGPGYSTVKPESFTPSGFTKTGPTKTGITTASLGGRGTYVVSTGKPRPAYSPDRIGEKAFEGNVVGYTKTSAEGSSGSQSFLGVTSTQSQDVNHVDTSKITLGPAVSTGYSYPKPSIQFETGGATSSTPVAISSTEGSIYSAPTPTPSLNVEIYNTPKILDSAPITSAPAVVNTYTYGKSRTGQTPGSTFGRVPTGFARRPVSPTAAPETYTTGPLENYRTTAFEAARIPVSISTVHPVIDTGYNTVVSSTAIPVTWTNDGFAGAVQTGPVSAHAQTDLGIDTSLQRTQFGDRQTYVSVTPSSQTVTAVPGYPSIKPRPFGPSTSVPSATYEQTLVTLQPQTNYGPSTTSPDSGYSYVTPETTFGQRVTSSSASESLKPQTQYLPSDSISPAVAVTYRKPFPVPGITYQQSTPQSVGPSETYYSGASGHQYSQGIETTIGSGGSPANVNIPRDEVGKLITNYNRGSTKYTANEYDTYSGSGTTGWIGDYSSKHSSSSSSSLSGGRTYISPTITPITVTTYSGGYSKPSTATSSYEVTTKPTTAVGKGKVIVKWSDLHPLLLGKLGAECTCKADPFANIRGPGKKLIPSSKGQVDLSNYDESEIYVDLERDGSYENGDYVTNYGSSSRGPVKILPQETPAVSAPSSTYLPVSSTIGPFIGASASSSSAGYDLRGSISASSSTSNVIGHSPAAFGVGRRVAKTLDSSGPALNSVAGPGASFDRYGPGGLRDVEETLEGANDCARPGLFRHPNFCNKFYACHWDQWKKKFTLHVFNCPVHLTFDSSASACNWPSKGPACQDDNLLV